MIEQALPFALSANTIAVMWLAGSKRALGWVLGLAGQGLWIAFSVVFEAWGLLPLAAALIVVYGRNLLRWRRDNDVTTDKESDYHWDWLTVVGVDTPYPPAVAEALEHVERETRRRAQATCEHRFDSYQTHIDDDGLIAWKVWQCSRCDFERRDECQHERTERFLLRTMNGEPCIDEVRCEDCGVSPNVALPIMIEWGNDIERLAAEVELMRPLRRGRLAESIDRTREDERG